MKEDIKLGYDDICLIPESLTDIEHRSECNPYDNDGYLPIFASCMSSVVSDENIKEFNNARIKAVLPRNYPLSYRVGCLGSDINFIAFSLEEVKAVFINDVYDLFDTLCDNSFNICIDLANGHMKSLLKVVKEIKSKWGDRVIIMTGNIANPEAYKYYEEAGVDYVRCFIGSGGCCSTASNTGVFYAPFSFLKETYEIKKKINGKCKIIADGGIHGYRDIQKALIYADYVMIGGLFNKAMESAGKTTFGKSYWNIRGYKILRPLTTLLTYGREVNRNDFNDVFKLVKANKLTIWKTTFGMSTKEAQRQINEANGKANAKLKTAEGLVKYQKVEYNLSGWAENETDYLRSAMSYTNSRTLDDYKESQWIRVTKRDYNN